jgi:Domain of unknown function (DUF3883)
MRIEVKGQSRDQEVELKGNEASAAEMYKDDFYLAVVADIPNNPLLYVLRNPAVQAKRDTLLVPVKAWMSRKWSQAADSGSIEPGSAGAGDNAH